MDNVYKILKETIQIKNALIVFDDTTANMLCNKKLNSIVKEIER